jgi:serine/threonine protein kinase
VEGDVVVSVDRGTKLGPYEIIALIGAGGMGEVYRARDTKLGRDVAIKILPEAFAQHADRMARFEREAKVLAALNHPNIAAIYAIEDRALVMELVEGETLKGPLPLETALAYALQIAEALEAAHERGITHRDLKPANIKVTPQGVVKVLDFGLASVSQASGADPSESPTLTITPTLAGMILGTAAYMSPEQARGKPVDKRADIWAFGVVLFEMLTSEKLFQGETVSDTLAAVLRAEIDCGKLPAQTPEPIRQLLRRCLVHDVRKRMRTSEKRASYWRTRSARPKSRGDPRRALSCGSGPVWPCCFWPCLWRCPSRISANSRRRKARSALPWCRRRTAGCTALRFLRTAAAWWLRRRSTESASSGCEPLTRFSFRRWRAQRTPCFRFGRRIAVTSDSSRSLN